MPKERVHHGKIEATYAAIPGDPQSAIIGREFDPGDPTIPKHADLRVQPSLDITWDRDSGNVQVSIDMPREQWFAIVKDLERFPDMISQAIYTDRLSRYEINNMIKTLRRARDQAHGADE